MTHRKIGNGCVALSLAVFVCVLITVGCSSSDVAPPAERSDAPKVVATPTASVASPTTAPPTVATEAVAPTKEPTATAPALQPYPYTSPLPPPTPTELDGLYTRQVDFIGTPTPCRRCAPYRAEGGTWTLSLDKGVFRVSHDSTTFTGVGSFTLSDDKMILFNDPNCHRGVGTYSWELDGRSLRLESIGDDCAFGLREKNLGAGSWLKQMDGEGRRIDPCQPPSLEAAISGHWPIPAKCRRTQ